jgi:hypothetical protein
MRPGKANVAFAADATAQSAADEIKRLTAQHPVLLFIKVCVCVCVCDRGVCACVCRGGGGGGCARASVHAYVHIMS